MDLDATLVSGLKTGTALTGAGTVVALVLVDVVLRAILRNRARATEHVLPAPGTEGTTGPAQRSLAGQALRGLAGPIMLLLWTYGLHFALAGPLDEILAGERAARIDEMLRWLRGTMTLVAVVWLLARVGRLVERGLMGFASRTDTRWDDLLLPLAGRAVRLMLPLLAIILAAPALEISAGLANVLQHGISMALIGVLVFLLLRFVDVGAQLILSRYPIAIADNLQARAVHTQITVLRKLAMTLIGLFGFASMLMVFDQVRQIGATLLASAGVAGIIIGFAAQKSLGALLAGFQIAMTQPVRVDDAVIVEGEFGRIEEITLTYVVVAIWDERRLVLPISYFIEKPFQNWTRTGSNILGTVMLYTDYGVPVDALRSELERLLKASDLWDGRVGVLHVTNAKERTLELRVLVSAADAGKSFDLCAHLREKLVSWVQQHHPESLPTLRIARARRS